MSTTAIRQLPLPTFFKAKNADDWAYEPNHADLFGQAESWIKKHDIKPSGHDGKKIELLLIDVQKDFCFPTGSLYVGGRSGKGAMEDNRKMAEFIYRNLGRISDIACTMDTHFPFQIFFPSFWEDKDGKPLGAHTVIKSEMIKSGEVRPTAAAAQIACDGNYPWLLNQVKFYCEQLEKGGKYSLYLWPYHCLIGSSGHVLSGVIEEARIFHAFTRKSVNAVEVKGGNLLTENYSVLSPEVLTRHDGKPLAQRNTAFIKKLLESDAVVIAGQASSHCVSSSIKDLLDTINNQDAKLVKKVYILKDCMSAVAVPDGKGGFLADFTPQAEKALKLFDDAGMHVVESTTPMEDWEGFPG